MTTIRLDSAVERRCGWTRATVRCEVEEPISMPTVVSSTLSAAQATSLTAASSALTWRCSNSRSCMAIADVISAASAAVPLVPSPQWGEGSSVLQQEEMGEGFSSVSSASDPLTPTLSPSGRGSAPSSWRALIPSHRIVLKPLLSRRLDVGPLVHEFAHAGRGAVLRKLLKINRVNAWILVLVFDLAAAVLHTHVHPEKHAPLVGGEGIAQAAERDREIARGMDVGIEVLVEHLVRRREHPAVAPVDALEILVAFVPEQRKAVAGHGKDVKIRTVPVRFLVSAHRHLRGMGVHDALGEDEHHVGAAGAALLPGFQLEAGEIGDEVRLPHVAAGPHRDELAFAAEVFCRALALGKLRRVCEHERLVVEQVEHEREIGRGSQARALAAAQVEMLVAGVERQREQTLRSPFEAVLAPVVCFDRRVAVPGQDVDDLFKEVLLWRRLRAGRKVEHEH